MKKTEGKSKIVRYNKWGYIFLIPFVLVYVIFQLIPLVSTIYNSFFENYRVGLMQVGPTWVGLENYKTIFSDVSLLKYTANTLIMWVIGFIPQIIVSLLLCVLNVVFCIVLRCRTNQCNSYQDGNCHSGKSGEIFL